MGLDIYLYRYENREASEKLTAQYEDQSNKNWEAAGKYESLDQQVTKDSIREQNKRFAVSIGLNEDGGDPSEERVEIDSAKYPEHYFKIGYFRSSYNGGGINRVLSNLGLPGLYDIFNRGDDDKYCFAPDWEMVKMSASSVLEQLKQKPNFKCFEVSGNEISGKPPMVMSEQEAIEATIKQVKGKDESDGGWSCLEGHFYPKGIEVIGILPGQRKRLFNDSYMPATYLVIKGESEWYCQALEIIIETCDFVLSKPDKEKYFLHWSS